MASQAVALKIDESPPFAKLRSEGWREAADAERNLLGDFTTEVWGQPGKRPS